MQNSHCIVDELIKSRGKWKKRSDITPPDGWRMVDCEAALDLWCQGFSKPEIAGAYGCFEWDLDPVSSRFKWPKRRDLKDSGPLRHWAQRTIPKRWTQEDYESARAMWLAGKTESQIGCAFGKSRHVINGIAHRFGWPPRESPIIRRETPAVPKQPKPPPFNLRPPLPAGHSLTWGLISSEPFPSDLAPVLSVGNRGNVKWDR